MRIFGVFTVRWLPQYASFKQEIIGDAEISVAQKITEGYDSETGAPGSLQAIGKYIRSSEENISTLTKKVGNGKNLLSGVITGSGWKSSAEITLTTTNYHNISVDDDGYFNIVTSTDHYLVSPLFNVEQGVVYMLSFYWNSGGTYQIGVKGSVTDIYTTSSSGGGVSFRFTAVATEQVRVFIGCSSITRPQVEVGSVATSFDAGTTEITSEIKQTANEINLNIEQGLERTGIHMEQGIIDLIADKTNFYTNSNPRKKMISFEMYDDGTGIGPLPSILFYDQNGQDNADHTAHLQWVLNFRGLTQAINASTPYSWGRQGFAVNQACYNAGVGMSELDKIFADEIGRALFGGNTGDMIRYRAYYVYYAGYYIGDDGMKQKSGGEYEEKYWDSQSVNSLSYPTGGHPSGYYLIENGETLLVTKIVSSNDSEARASADFDGNTLRAGAIEDNTETPDDTALEGGDAGNEVASNDQQASDGEVIRIEGFKYYDLVSLNANGELLKVYEKFLQAHYSWTQYTDGRPADYGWCRISEIKGSLCDLSEITIRNYLD